MGNVAGCLSEFKPALVFTGGRRTVERFVGTAVRRGCAR